MGLGLAMLGAACGDAEHRGGDGGSDAGGSDASGAGGGSGDSTSGGSSTTGGTGGGQAGKGGTSTTAGSGGKQSGGSANQGGTDAAGGADAGPLPPELTWTKQGFILGVNAIWGSGAQDIYAVGGTGLLLHSKGDGTWTAQMPQTSANLTGVWGSGPDDVYVAVNANVILHSTGDGKWEHQAYDSGFTFTGVWGLDAEDVYLTGPGVVQGGASDWGSPQQVSNAAPTFAIWGSSPTDLYVTTGSAALSIIYHSDGDGTWKPQTAPDATAGDAIWGLDAQHIWVAADYDVLFSTGNGSWTSQLTAPMPKRVRAIWGAGPNAIYACTQQGLFYRSNGGGTWSVGQEIDPAADPDCTSIWGTGPDDIYVAGPGGIYHGVPK
jgi:hypothetical protein